MRVQEVWDGIGTVLGVADEFAVFVEVEVGHGQGLFL